MKNKIVIHAINAFIITIIFVVTIFTLSNRLLFGEYIFLHSDLQEQYAPFIRLFWNQLFQEHSILYSFNIGMGVPTIPIYAFYSCFNPLNIIFLLVDDINIASFILFCLKTSLAAVFFQLFQEKILKTNLKWSVLFSVLYGLNGFVINNYFNIIWLDGLYCLPLIIIAIDALVKKNNMHMLTICYFYLFIVNFYSGYIVGFFSAIVFLIFYLKESSNKVFLLLKYVFSVITAILLSAIVLLPTATTLIMSKKDDDRSFSDFSFSVFSFFRNILPGAKFEDYNNAPYLYCGIVTIILGVLFFMSKRIENKIKLKSMVLILLLLICCIWKPAYMFMHCFDIPDHFNFRFSFLICFVLLSSASYLCGVYLKLVSSKHKIIVYITILCTGFELIYGSVLSVISMGVLNREKVIVYDEFYKENHHLLEENADKCGYRVFSGNALIANEAASYNYNSIGYFTTIENKNYRNTMSKLGYATTNACVMDLGSTPVTRMLWGQKYIYNLSNMNIGYIDEYLTENCYALPLAYYVSGEIYNVDINGENPFENINNVIAGMTGENIKPFIENENVHFELENADYYSADGKEYFSSIDLDKITLVNFVCPDEAYDYAYFSRDISIACNDAPLIVCDEKATSTNLFSSDLYLTHIIDVSDDIFNNKNISIAMGLNTQRICDYNNAFFYNLDAESCEKALNKLLNNSIEVNFESSSSIKITCCNEIDAPLFCSIPYDAGWKMTVDGVYVEPKAVINNTFICVDLIKGEHEIVLKYVPKDIGIAVLLFIVGSLLFLGEIFIFYRCKT